MNEQHTALQTLEKDVVRDYRTAAETVPHLMEQETPLISFLRTADFDPTKAARRLALYWKFRREIFGERWLLPMTQTGRGALSMSDVETLRSGYLLVFPIANAGPVLLLDSTRLPHSLPSVLDRCIFYMLTVSTDERAQTEGGVLLSIVSSRKGPTKTVAQRSRQWEFVHAAIPPLPFALNGPWWYKRMRWARNAGSSSWAINRRA
jgi:hypothetical protein